MDDATLERLFAVIRTIKRSGLTQAEVDAVKAALAGSAPIVGTKTLSFAGRDLIHSFESYKAVTYPDPGPTGLPVTGGWGTTVDADGNPFKLGVEYPKEYWDKLYARDIGKFERAVTKLCPITTQNQFDALVSFAYNVGEGNLKDSSLRRLHNEGRYNEAKEQFVRWNKAGGVVLKGLTRRRLAEAELYGR